MRVIAIIPVRLESSRLQEKALLDIHGKPMVMHVYDNAKSCTALERVIIATDSPRIREVCTAHNADIIMTGVCSSGTERVFNALDSLEEEYDIVINIQGDEPLIQPSQIKSLISAFDNINADIATLSESLTKEKDNQDPNTVKLIYKQGDEVLDFSRGPVDGKEKYKHIGLYAFRTSIIPALRKIEMTERRKKESLEQLDWLLSGFSIYAKNVEGGLISVDTRKDLDRVLRKLTMDS